MLINTGTRYFIVLMRISGEDVCGEDCSNLHSRAVMLPDEVSKTDATSLCSRKNAP